MATFAVYTFTALCQYATVRRIRAPRPGRPVPGGNARTTVGEAIHNAVAYLKAHPDEARYTDSAAVARLESGLTVTAPNGRGITTDMSRGVGGSDRVGRVARSRAE